MAAGKIDSLDRAGRIARGIRVHCGDADGLRLGTHDRHAVSGDAILIDGRRLRRRDDVERRWLIIQIEDDPVDDDIVAADDA